MPQSQTWDCTIRTCKVSQFNHPCHPQGLAHKHYTTDRYIWVPTPGYKKHDRASTRRLFQSLPAEDCISVHLFYWYGWSLSSVEQQYSCSTGEKDNGLCSAHWLRRCKPCLREDAGWHFAQVPRNVPSRGCSYRTDIRTVAWKPVEHIAFLIKPCQTLKVLPDFEGVSTAGIDTQQELSWCSINTSLPLLAKFCFPKRHHTQSHREYVPPAVAWDDSHVSRRAWRPAQEHRPVLENGSVRVRQFPGSADVDNPAAKMIDCLEENFVRMSCSGLILDTTKIAEHSATLRDLRLVSCELVRKYVRAWKEMGFLRIWVL